MQNRQATFREGVGSLFFFSFFMQEPILTDFANAKCKLVGVMDFILQHPCAAMLWESPMLIALGDLCVNQSLKVILLVLIASDRQPSNPAQC
jgi:2-succinyl-5-enolpyruvyl-6-hydroxy-3-cyclohexene-1-carboxylate synthase